MTKSTSSELVSVVVPTRTSARTLEACLHSIRQQTYPAIELIVVDNDSRDGTLEMARQGADIVVAAGPERSAQRNAGARKATGSYLLFIDSDMSLEPTVVADCIDAARAGGDAVLIPEVSFGEGFWARCKALERRCYVGDDTIEAARFFTRQTFANSGGYDDELTGPEDWDLHERVRSSGARIARIESQIWHDEGRLGFYESVSTKFYYGKSIGRYLAKHPTLAKRQARLFRPAFVRNRRRLLKQPLTLTGMFALKACELGAASTGMLAARLQTLRGRHSG